MFHTWQPVPTPVTPEALAADDDAPHVAGAASATSRTVSVANLLIVVCVIAIIAVVVLSAFRLAGLADLGLSSEQLSARFRGEALLWIPTVAVVSAGLAGATLLRAKLTN